MPEDVPDTGALCGHMRNSKLTACAHRMPEVFPDAGAAGKPSRHHGIVWAYAEL